MMSPETPEEYSTHISSTSAPKIFKSLSNPDVEDKDLQKSIRARSSRKLMKSPVKNVASCYDPTVEGSSEVLPEVTTFIAKDHSSPVSCVERAPSQEYLSDGSASVQVPFDMRKSLADGNGNENSMPEKYAYMDAGHEEPPAPISPLHEDGDRLMAGITPVHSGGSTFGNFGLALPEDARYFEVVTESAASIDYDRLLAVSCMEAAPLPSTNGSAFDQALFEGLAKCGGDKSSMTDLDTHHGAGREEPPVPVGSLPKDCSGLLESMPPVYSDPAFCTVEGRGDGSSMQVPSFDQTKATEHMEFNSTVLEAVLDLIGVPSHMRPGAAQSTETPVSVTGPDGFVYTYLPSDLEEAKRMSADELVVGIESMSEELTKYSKFNAEAGAILADYMRDYGRVTLESC